MYGTDDPGEMAPEARFREVAAILAKGLLRLATQGEVLRHVAKETEAVDGSVSSRSPSSSIRLIPWAGWRNFPEAA
ncbi:MAG: hypothetical protein AB1640_07795 [bacterium]